MLLNIMSFGIAAIFISPTSQGRRHFVKYVNPIFIKGADYTHQNTTRICLDQSFLSLPYPTMPIVTGDHELQSLQ